MFSNQCHYCEKDIRFISHSFKNIWIEQNTKELLILTKSCPFFLDFLSSIGNNRVPPNSRSVQKKEQDNNKKSVLKSKQAVNEAVKFFTVKFCIILWDCISLWWFQQSEPLPTEARQTFSPEPHNHTHTSQLKTTNGKRDNKMRRKQLPGYYKDLARCSFLASCRYLKTGNIWSGKD